MKAILITKANQAMLASRYNMEEFDISARLPVGYYLVTDFGNEETFETLTPELFAQTYVKIEDIKNEFISIARI